jgi:hypothetical protein
MISSTPHESNRLWRVEFDMVHSEVSKTGIVCYLYLTERGIRIYYAHHAGYSRPMAKGPWSSDPAIFRQPINPTLRSIIHASLFSMLLSDSLENNEGEILEWPGRENEPVELIDLGI